MPKSLVSFILSVIMQGPPWAQAGQKKTFFTPQIAIKITMSGDMSNSYQFSGPIGSYLRGEPEKSDGPCENSSSFLQVMHRQKKSLQIWMRLKCTVSGQTFEFKPQRFFVDLSHPDQTFFLPAQSEKFRKVALQFSEIQIKDAQLKK